MEKTIEEHELLNNQYRGLAVGMAVAMLIGMWVFDELSFNKNHEKHSRIGRVFGREQ
jgi:surface polysaccharide O-acyltransferase-like enzyme